MCNKKDMQAMAFLELQCLSKQFGGLAAVSELDLAISAGEIRGLIGPNGAGKTTVFNMISGVYKPTEGRVIFDGEDITGLPAHEVAKRQLSRTFQLTAVFREFTVLRNLLAAYHLFSKAGFWNSVLNTSLSKKEEEQFMENALETLRFLGIEDLKNEIAKNLPYGHQRVMSLGMALILKPKLLMLDEPVSGMNPQETKNMMDRIRETRDKKGVTVFLVEHNMKAVMGISDQISVLSFGKKIAEGTPQEIKANPAVIEAYLGVEDYVA